MVGIFFKHDELILVSHSTVWRDENTGPLQGSVDRCIGDNCNLDYNIEGFGRLQKLNVNKYADYYVDG